MDAGSHIGTVILFFLWQATYSTSEQDQPDDYNIIRMSTMNIRYRFLLINQFHADIIFVFPRLFL